MTLAPIRLLLWTALISWPWLAGAEEFTLPPTGVVPNRAPLSKTPFAALPLGSVRPQGWLLKQCELQRDGLTGNAEAVYADDLGANSAWLGGSGEAWERGPYYLKGLVALAYTLDDPGLKQKAQKWIDWLVEHQGADGYLGPAANNDWWPRMVATYALKDYYEATADARVPVVLDHYFHYLLANLSQRPLKEWGKARAGDEMEVALWLYSQNGDTNLLSLVQLLQKQAYDWTGIFTSNRFMLYGTDFQPKHNVNVEQALKFPPVYHQLSAQPDDDAALALGLNNLMREHGLPCGINSGTEFLAGNSSIQGVELCAIVEAMLSLETAVRITGDPVLADRLETISFNALPAALGHDIKALQYYILPNTVIATNGGHGFGQDYANAILPGPHSGFPCCRYNFHMGWPKFVQNSWAATDDGGLALMAYAPTAVNSLVHDVRVQISEETGYPFAELVRLRISAGKPVTFPLVLRIPAWCSNALVTVNGRAQGRVAAASFYRLARKWKSGDTVDVRLPMAVQLLSGPSRSVAVSRGPLVYALKVGEQWDVRTPDPLKLGFDEFELRATTPWNYALALDPANPAASLTFTNGAVPENPFDPKQSSVALLAQGRQLPDWTIGWRGTHAFEPPVSPVAADGPLEKVTLVPFGSQHLRISWFPYLGSPQPVTTSFTEDFDPSWSQRWTVFGGNWVARNGTLSTVPLSGNGPKAFAMATAFTNFIYQADVLAGTQGDAGLVFRASQPDLGADAYCGYYVGINPQASRMEFGYASNSWNVIARSPMSCTPNKFYRLKVQAVGTHLQIFINEQPVMDVRDDHFSSGMIGVRDFCVDDKHSVSSFAGLTVKSLAP
ncbi:MAG: beta-L-arabinofuranosidase domain-containing protein [Verrucomicrobiota bacterium]|jgi:hypothetical protein